MNETDIRVKTAELVDAFKRMNKHDAYKNEGPEFKRKYTQAQESVESLAIELVTQVLIDLHTLAEAAKAYCRAVHFISPSRGGHE